MRAASTLVLCLLPSIAGAQAVRTVQTVHTFEVAPHAPIGGLVDAGNGFLYGTTSLGGPGGGTIYRIPIGGGPPAVVHQFTSGRTPDAALTRGQDGFLYGTTREGGAHQPIGTGTVFRFDAAMGSFVTIHAFVYPDGRQPVGRIIQASDGLLYGTTLLEGGGQIYQIDPATGTTRWLHQFLSDDPLGATPSGGLTEAPDGFLYGVMRDSAILQGSVNNGSVYRLNRASGAVTLVHAFGPISEGWHPVGGLTLTSDGFLYGITSGGGSNDGGTIFRIEPSTGTFTVVEDLDPSAGDPRQPLSRLVEGSDRTLYGTTSFQDGGTIFRLTRTGANGHALSILRVLDPPVTGAPAGDLVLASDGWIYGTAPNGGPSGGGTLIRFDSLQRGAPADPWQFEVVHAFSSRSGGWRPAGPPIPMSDGLLYGVTEAGGANGVGTIYRFDPATGVRSEVGPVPAAFTVSSFAGPSHSGLVDGGDGSAYAVVGNESGIASAIVKVTPSTNATAAVYTFGPLSGSRRVYPVLARGPGGLFGVLREMGGVRVYRFDPAAPAHTPIATLPESPDTELLTMAVIAPADGEVYVAYTFIGRIGRFPALIGHLFRIDPAAGTASLLASTGTGGAAPDLGPDGRIYFAGANGATVQAIEPATGVQQQICALPVSANITVVAIASDGGVFAVAGESPAPSLYKCGPPAAAPAARLYTWPIREAVTVVSDLALAGTTFYGTTAGVPETIFRIGASGTTELLDRDGDGLGDDWETDFGLDPASTAGAAGAGGDPDGDGLSNLEEQEAGSHPRGAFTRYLAEGTSNAFFRTTIALGNAAHAPATVLLTFQTDANVVVRHRVIVPATSRRTIDPGTIVGAGSFSTVIESDLRVTADRTMSWDASGYGSHTETATAAPATSWYLAEGSTSGDFELFYLLQNPGGTPVTATVRYLRPSGLPAIESPYSLPAHGRTTIYVDRQGAELASTDVSAVITAPSPIIVERAMYRGRPGQPFAAGHASAGVTAPALEWFLAEGATGSFFDLFVLVANPNPTPAQITAEYLRLGGSVFTKTYTVPANGRFTIWVDDEVIPAGSGQKPLMDAALSTTIRSTNGVPIVVERTMWWPSPQTSADFWYETHNSPGATATAMRWGFAGAEVGGLYSGETYMLIANPTAAAGRALVRLYFESGNTAARSYDLPPQSRTNVQIAGDFPETFVNGKVAVVIESLGPSPVPIVVEGAMYGSPDGVVWARGSNALATPLP